MQFKKDADVVNAKGEKVGEVDRVVIDPKRGEVSHIVVRKGWLLPVDKVIPVGAFTASEDERLLLTPEVSDLKRFPDFIETEFIPADAYERNALSNPVGGAAPMYWYPPVGVSPTVSGLGAWGWGSAPIGAVYPTQVETEENIPAGSIALKEGAAVVDPNGKTIGKVEKVITNTDNEQVTHLVLTKGIFDQKKKLIPANWIRNITEEGVRISVDLKVIDDLKDYNEP